MFQLNFLKSILNNQLVLITSPSSTITLHPRNGELTYTRRCSTPFQLSPGRSKSVDMLLVSNTEYHVSFRCVAPYNDGRGDRSKSRSPFSIHIRRHEYPVRCHV